MSLAVLVELKDALKAHQPLRDYLQARYGTTARHLVGYEEGSANAKDRPAFFYIVGKREYNKSLTHSTSNGLLMVQVIEKEIVDDVCKGSQVCDELIEMIVDFLKAQPLTHANFLNVKMATDFSVQHPFYEAGISFEYQHHRRKT